MSEPSKTIPCSALLQKAVKLDNDGLYTEAISLYEEGIKGLLEHVKTVDDKKQQSYLMLKVSDFMERAEKIKSFLRSINDTTNHEHIDILDNSIGFSYRTVFKKYFDETVVKVCIKDPYIRLYHQVQNLLRFIELAITSCKRLRLVELITTIDESYESMQSTWLDKLRLSLQVFEVQLIVSYSSTLHDRSIILDNGWVIKLGRGLDYFKSVDKFCPGYHDMDLRPCYETSIDVYRVS